MSFSEIRLTLPKDARPSLLAYAIWSAGVTPWSWAMQAGPDFLPEHTTVQIAGWLAYEAQMSRERRTEHDDLLEAEIDKARAMLREQGYSVDGPPEAEVTP